jgi:hypothetical protein
VVQVIARRNSRPGGAATVGSITRSTGAEHHTAIALLPTGLAARRAEIHSPTARRAPGSRLAGRVEMWAIIGPEVPGAVIVRVVQA